MQNDAPIKSADELIRELRTALKSIAHSTDSFKEDSQDFHLLAMLSQARALLANGGKNQRPFLIDMANEHDIILEVFSYPKIELSENQIMGGLTYMGPTWLTFSTEASPYFQRYSLAEWMEAPAYSDGHGKIVSRNTLLRELTDKQVVHYDQNKGRTVAALEAHITSVNGEWASAGSLDHFILDICSAITYLGEKFLRLIELKVRGLPPEQDQYLMNLELAYSLGMPQRFAPVMTKAPSQA